MTYSYLRKQFSAFEVFFFMKQTNIWGGGKGGNRLGVSHYPYIFFTNGLVWSIIGGGGEREERNEIFLFGKVSGV